MAGSWRCIRTVEDAHATLAEPAKRRSVKVSEREQRARDRLARPISTGSTRGRKNRQRASARNAKKARLLWA